jgi:hypothetical protein
VLFESFDKAAFIPADVERSDGTASVHENKHIMHIAKLNKKSGIRIENCW